MQKNANFSLNISSFWHLKHSQTSADNSDYYYQFSDSTFGEKLAKIEKHASKVVYMHTLCVFK